ncbi:hypothetical protein [Exiguobacterium sp. S3]|uniref:hypothetical protein n=1 Tax=Exiguobacterium sp. S3 TaxID=483245 RepID=UPI001BEA0292|nr:hypothetical protein [Exiguobacterium sp. S3]
MNENLKVNEVFQFMREFGVDLINRYGDLIIDEPTNTYTSITNCNDMDDVKTSVVFALCRPICKGLKERDANRLLERVNSYFHAELTRNDMSRLYEELCYVDKFTDFKEFIQRGFPMSELSEASE